jgi:molecular chaperone GrpE (heat shock protein)
MEIIIYGNEHYKLPPPDLTVEIDRLQEELLIERNRTLQALADFRNYRRRVELDVNMLVEESQQGKMNSIIKIINDMQNLCDKNNQLIIYVL